MKGAGMPNRAHIIHVWNSDLQIVERKVAHFPKAMNATLFEMPTLRTMFIQGAFCLHKYSQLYLSYTVYYQ